MGNYNPFKKCKHGFVVSEAKIRGPAPDRIVRDPGGNKVYADYGKYRQTWTAEGEGNERHNFVETIEEVTSNDS